LFKARLARFYSFSNTELDQMPMDTAMDYHISMEVINSEEMSRLARATSVHAMSKSGRDNYFKALNKATKLVKQSKNDNVLSVEEVAQTLARTMTLG
jgi:serine phosphatase RsbU (regulator of sigma subunit)